MFPSTMQSMWCGNTKTNTDADNVCDVNSVASPDNMAFLNKLRKVVVTEDTSAHGNDVAWLVDTKTSACSS